MTNARKEHKKTHVVADINCGVEWKWQSQNKNWNNNNNNNNNNLLIIIITQQQQENPRPLNNSREGVVMCFYVRSFDLALREIGV